MGDDARAVNEGLARRGPFGLLEQLGVAFRREGPRLARLLCPWHNDRSPSASLSQGPEGTLRLHCYVCQRTADALALVAHARGLDLEYGFVETLIEGARLAGLYQLEADLCDREGRERPPPRPPGPPPAALPPERPRGYPPAGEVEALWASCLPLVDYRPAGPFEAAAFAPDPEAYALLERRRISPEAVTDLDLARVLDPGEGLPWWASRRGARPKARSWLALAYRLVLPTYDATGAMRGLRAWRLGPPELEGEPSRLPPAGFDSKGLVLACPAGRAMLAGQARPGAVVVAEGESDFLSWATHWSDAEAEPPAVLGLYSGSWSAELAARVPDGARVAVWTDPDEAGERYAELLYSSLGDRCELGRASAPRAA